MSNPTLADGLYECQNAEIAKQAIRKQKCLDSLMPKFFSVLEKANGHEGLLNDYDFGKLTNSASLCNNINVDPREVLEEAKKIIGPKFSHHTPIGGVYCWKLSKD